MPLLGTKGQSASINAVMAAITHLALHGGAASAGAGTTGANEQSTARQPVGTTPFSTSTAGSASTNNNAYTFATPGTVPVQDVGGWDQLTTGNFVFAWHLGASVTAASVSVAAGALSATAS